MFYLVRARGLTIVDQLEAGSLSHHYIESDHLISRVIRSVIHFELHFNLGCGCLHQYLRSFGSITIITSTTSIKQQLILKIVIKFYPRRD